MTTIRNGRGITSVQQFQDEREAGQPIGRGYDRAYENPLLPQVTVVTLAEQVDVSDEIVAGQVWTITLTDPDGVQYQTLYTVTGDDDTAGTDADGLEYMAGVLAAAMEADSQLDNIVSAVATGPGLPSWTITWLHPDQGDWTVTAVCTPFAAETVLLATAVTSQTAGGTTIPMGRFVDMAQPEPGGLRRAVLPTTSTGILAGLTLRDISQVRPFDTSAAAVNAYPTGEMMGVREEGDAAVLNVGPAAALGDEVHVVISTAGGDALGEARADRQGVAHIVTATPTVANTTPYSLQVSIAAQDGLPELTRTFAITSDGTATDVEINDALRAQMAADAEFTARVVASGTTTLVLTGQDPGVSFTVLDVQEGAGDWTSITVTQAAVPYTRLLPRVRWIRPTPSGTVGVARLTR